MDRGGGPGLAGVAVQFGRLRANRQGVGPCHGDWFAHQLHWGRTIRAVRINGLHTPWCHGDIVEVVAGAQDALDVIMIPKVLSARDVWWVDVLLTRPIAGRDGKLVDAALMRHAANVLRRAVPPETTS